MIRAREQLLLDVSHELRSPLSRMRVAAEFSIAFKDNPAVNGPICTATVC